MKNNACNVARACVLFLAVTLVSAWTQAPGRSDIPTVVVIHSYNVEYRWTSDIHQGIVDRLASLKKPYLICTEFLDWKRNPDPGLMARELSLISYKYRGKRVDLVITSDDKALELVCKNRQDLFPQAPIVFTGVYQEALAGLTEGQDNITGVFEDQDVAGTILYALQMRGDAKTAYVVSDYNESGQAVEARLKAALASLAPSVSIRSLSELSINEIESVLSHTSKEDMVFIGSYSIDRDGTTYTGETLIARVAAAANTPVFVLNTHHLGTGAIGGHLISPYLLGSKAGELAIRILSGDKASSIKPIESGIHTPLFDAKVAERFGITNFPPRARFLNRTESPVNLYRTEIVAAAAIIILLLALIQVLAIAVGKTRKLAKAVALRNEALAQANDRIAESEERFRLSSIGSHDALWDFDYARDAFFLSDRWYEMTGYSRERFSGADFEGTIHPQDRKLFTAAIKAHERGERDHINEELRVRCATGSWKWIRVRGKSGRVENGAITRLAGSITDIDAVKKSRAEIESLAFYDQLTSLPNRAKAAELAEQAIRLVGEGKTCSLILIDIDDFKTVNDTYGHEIGDKIILFMAKELSSLCDENIAVSRIGGDEFTVFAALTSADATERLAKLAVRLVSRKIEIDGRFHYPTASAGIALYPDHGKHFIELLGKADAALAIAKKAGKGCVHIFNDAIQRKLIARRQLEAGLRGAIENKELSTAFQPQMDVQTGRISGFEALARWNSDSYGPVSPAEFIPLAEETGMVDRIGMFVLSSALDFIKRADLMGRHDFSVSVNVSPMQLLDDNFVPRVLRMIDEAHVSANRVSLEITESVLIVGLEETVAKLNRIRQSGIKISLDDFGKGYSSLLYLKELPIDCVKIDKAFVDDILSEEKTKVLARNIVTIAHQLGFTVVAEGVETGDQLEYLKDCECDSIQGYFFSKPKTRDDALSQLGQMDLRG